MNNWYLKSINQQRYEMNDELEDTTLTHRTRLSNMQWDLEKAYIPSCAKCQWNKDCTSKPTGLFTLYQSQTLISTLWLWISSVCFQKRMEGILFWQWPNFWAPISNRSHLFIVDCCTDHPHCIWQLVLWKWSDDRDNIRLWCSIHIGALGHPTQADGGQTQDVHSISP